MGVSDYDRGVSDYDRKKYRNKALFNIAVAEERLARQKLEIGDFISADYHASIAGCFHNAISGVPE